MTLIKEDTDPSTEVPEGLATSETPCTFDGAFYEKAKQYWSKIEPTVDGVLGGFGYISQSDITGSKTFLHGLFAIAQPPKKRRALDCGAGIGRVTKHLLAHFFEKVDLVDQNSDFVNQVTKYTGSIPQIGELYIAGLQEFKPVHQYDVIWCQWVLGHLTDSDLVEFMKKCQNSLTEEGVIIIKENLTSTGNVEVDSVDSSVTRPLNRLEEIFNSAGLEIVSQMYQKNFPKGLYPVIMMAMRPRKTIDSTSINQCS
ncbi:protein N-terminal methyltransferase [Nesidiocoris tenuis]|uniref:Alpha N-terminal protein methyltransferase 1 n=1 Tax=Nesidiocoris tenuis TaxID=355587 RepID=A0ABN7A8M1_9HEMI|nr:protein N-terminal methyltransferase [Nesidiocoris tenuis]